MKYPCSRGRNQDWKTNTLNTYEQWDENENKRQPNYIMDNDIFNIRAREHVKIGEKVLRNIWRCCSFCGKGYEHLILLRVAKFDVRRSHAASKTATNE